MDATYWQKQTDKPLFETLMWSRPEYKMHAGKLLIIGGNAHGFAAPAEAYDQARKAGVGSARVVLPDAIKKIIKAFLDKAEFAASTPSGSFAADAYGELILQSEWADGVLLAGDLGRNSETAVILEKFTNNYTGQLTITKDALEYFHDTPESITKRPDTTIVCTIAQLQKLLQKSGYARPVTFGMDLVQLVDVLHDFSSTHECNIVIKHMQNLIVACNGQVSSTKLTDDLEHWRVKTAAHTCTWWLQNKNKPFESMTTAIYNMFDEKS
ncbi:MAG: hypothetical protein U5K77_00255 [Candidatus Saccharibacteria bacterium]|nr:hypothetical protein [Candidatus Saccharibacteria bacterium]